MCMYLQDRKGLIDCKDYVSASQIVKCSSLIDVDENITSKASIE